MKDKVLEEASKIQGVFERVRILRKAGFRAYFDVPSQTIIIGHLSPAELLGGRDYMNENGSC